MPAYLFADEKTKANYDPIYNPDRYLSVKNASWMQLPDQTKDNITVFQFMLANDSKFAMESVKLLITVKGKDDIVLEKEEIPIEGQVPAAQSVMVGTLAPDPHNKTDLPRLMTDSGFAELAKTDPDLQLRYSEGIEVKMQSKEFEKATVDLLEVHTVVGAKPGGGSKSE